MQILGNLEGFLEPQILANILYLKLFPLNYMQTFPFLLHPYISNLVLYMDYSALYRVSNTFLFIFLKFLIFSEVHHHVSIKTVNVQNAKPEM